MQAESATGPMRPLQTLGLPGEGTKLPAVCPAWTAEAAGAGQSQPESGEAPTVPAEAAARGVAASALAEGGAAKAFSGRDVEPAAI